MHPLAGAMLIIGSLSATYALGTGGHNAGAALAALIGATLALVQGTAHRAALKR